MGQTQSYNEKPCKSKRYRSPRRSRKMRERMREPRRARVGRSLTLDPIFNQPEILPPKFREYDVHRRQDRVEDVTLPVDQTVFQPIVQPVVRQPREIVDTYVRRRIQPVVTQHIVPQYSTVVREGAASEPIYTPPVVEDERLDAIVRVERAPAEYESDFESDYDDEEEEYLEEDRPRFMASTRRALDNM